MSSNIRIDNVSSENDNVSSENDNANSENDKLVNLEKHYITNATNLQKLLEESELQKTRIIDLYDETFKSFVNLQLNKENILKNKIHNMKIELEKEIEQKKFWREHYDNLTKILKEALLIDFDKK